MLKSFTNSHLLLFLYLTFLYGFQASPPTTSNLLAVQLIFRHGDRTLKTASTSYSAPKLTNGGKKELFELGQFIRNRYNSFLGPQMLSSESMEILSSDMDRTIDSAQLFACGLFDHFQKEPGWNEGKLSYEPFPVRSIPTNIDRYLQVTEPCPRYGKQLFQESGPACFNYIKTECPELVETFLEMNPELSQSDPSVPLWVTANNAFTSLADEVKYNVTENLPLSKIGEKLRKFPILQNYNHICQIHLLNTEEKLRLYSGSLHQRLVENFQGKSPKKLRVFSAHDRTLNGQLMILGVIRQKEPATGSVLIYELHSGSRMGQNETFLKVFFKDGLKAELEEIHIKICGQVSCDFRIFLKLTKKYIPVDFYEECQLK